MRRWYHTRPRPPFAKPRILRKKFFLGGYWVCWFVELYGCERYYTGTFRDACGFARHLWQQDYMRRLLDEDEDSRITVDVGV